MSQLPSELNPAIVVTSWVGDRTMQFYSYFETPEATYEAFSFLSRELQRGHSNYITLPISGDDMMCIPVDCIVKIETRFAKKPEGEKS